LGVIGVMLVVGSAVALLDTTLGDAGWLFVLPVVVSAIAGGLGEGLTVALPASLLSALFFVNATGDVNEAEVLSAVTTRFPLYGLTAAFLGVFAEAHYALQSNLRHLASTDPLTRVSNVASFYDELGVMESSDAPFAVQLVDVDDLKAVNDRYGHQVGSAVIQLVAGALRRAVRASDCVARYGGDEFVVILKDAGRTGAQIAANRMREELEEARIVGLPELRISVSVGTALYGEDGETSEELLSAADRDMYRDKRSRKATA
jgi:diguanylate cyclase (GGDEF)-like protein